MNLSQDLSGDLLLQSVLLASDINDSGRDGSRHSPSLKVNIHHGDKDDYLTVCRCVVEILEAPLSTRREGNLR